MWDRGTISLAAEHTQLTDWRSFAVFDDAPVENDELFKKLLQ